MKLSRSGAYPLPGQMWQAVGNCALKIAPLVPAPLRTRYLANWSYYQVSSPDASGDYQGVSARKWDALQMPSSLKGKSVLDIGCSEGYFAQRCAERGAAPVVAVDGSLGRLLTARFLSLRDRLNVSYRMGLFPGSRIGRSFNYVLCLSVIHHSLAQKDIWKVLVERQYDADLMVLRAQLRLLRQLTASYGRCIIEMPYEYDDPASERKVVDFDIFGKELVLAGFAVAKCQGTWDFNPEHKSFKDRIIYVADA